jgi:hypothetical protein
MSDFKLYSVNWQDGMLITQKHLREQERYLEHLSQWHALKAGDNYGLIRKSFSGRSALSLNISVSGNRLRVAIDTCQALTPDGHYIDIGESNRDVVRGEAEISETTVPVYIGVDSEAKKAVGDPDPGEDVPRVPYLINQYSVHLGATPNMPEGCYVQVAELTINGSEVTLSPKYYPPCVTVYADERLSETASDLRNRLENLLSLSTRAYRAISASGSLKGESTSLQVAFKDTIGNFIHHLASTIDGFVVGPNAVHPIDLVIIFKKLFRVFSTLSNLHPGLKDYLNERYFSKELNSEIGRFLSAIEGFIMTDYNHHDIGGHVKVIDEILDVLRGVFAFLAQTKREELGEQAVATETLTYKGRTYRNLTYSGSRVEQVGELCYLLIDISEPSPVSDLVSLMTKDLFNDAEWQNMQVRLGLNEARGLGETDPIDVDTSPDKFAKLGQMDLILYSM